MSIVGRNDEAWLRLLRDEQSVLTPTELASFKDEQQRSSSKTSHIEMGLHFIADALYTYGAHDEMTSGIANDASALIALLTDDLRECIEESHVGLAGRALHFERLNKMAREALAQTSPPSGERRGALRQIRKRRTVRRASA